MNARTLFFFGLASASVAIACSTSSGTGASDDDITAIGSDGLHVVYRTTASGTDAVVHARCLPGPAPCANKTTIASLDWDTYVNVLAFAAGDASALLSRLQELQAALAAGNGASASAEAALAGVRAKLDAARAAMATELSLLDSLEAYAHSLRSQPDAAELLEQVNARREAATQALAAATADVSSLTTDLGTSEAAFLAAAADLDSVTKQLAAVQHDYDADVQTTLEKVKQSLDASDTTLVLDTDRLFVLATAPFAPGALGAMAAPLPIHWQQEGDHWVENDISHRTIAVPAAQHYLVRVESACPLMHERDIQIDQQKGRRLGPGTPDIYDYNRTYVFDFTTVSAAPRSLGLPVYARSGDCPVTLHYSWR